MAKAAHDIVGLKVEPHTELIVRDKVSGRFQPGTTGGAGRPKGARHKLTTQFLDDLAESWAKEGASALARCAAEDPTGYVRVVANLLPKEALLAVSVDTSLKVAVDAAQAFALLSKLDKPELLELQANGATPD
jgi:hypothetical protein